METLKLQPINLQQGLLLTSNGTLEGVYNHWKKTIYFKHGELSVKHFVLPEEIENYQHNYDYDSFGFTGWHLSNSRSEAL